MIHFINKFKIPTLLGLTIILLGITSGVFLVLKEQVFLSQAAPGMVPSEVTFTNIEDTSGVVSWQTSSAVPSFITYGSNNPGEQTALDVRDKLVPQPYLVHYVILKNLLPKTTYQLRVVSGKEVSQIFTLTTNSPSSNKTVFNPVIGSVLDKNVPLDEGIAYLSISNTITQSSLIKGGNFLISLSKIEVEKGAIAKLTIISSKGEASALLKLNPLGSSLPTIKLGQNLDLTADLIPENEASPSAEALERFDLNGDGQINTADNSIILRNFGKNPKETKADLDGNKVIDEKDLKILSEQINKQINLR